MKLLRYFTGSLLLTLLRYQPAASQALDPAFTPPTGLYAPGEVRTLGPPQADGKRLVAGSFSRVNDIAVSSLVRLDAAGTLDQAFSQRVGEVSNVSRIKGLPAGQYLLGAASGTLAGFSVRAGGLTRAGLLRLNPDGTADASFDVGTGPAQAAGYPYPLIYEAQPDGKVLVGGSFTTFNGRVAHGLVRLNANGSVDTSFDAGAGLTVPTAANTPTIEALAVQPDGKILVSGSFAAFNGQPANGLLRLTSNGSLDATFAHPLLLNSFPSGLLVQPDGKVLVSGILHVGTTTPGLLRLTASGSLDASFTSSAFTKDFLGNYYGSNVLLQPDGKIVLFGSFTTTASAGPIIRLNADGSPDATFQVANGPSGVPGTLGLQADGSILVGGNFNTFNGTETPLGRLTSAGAADPAFTPKVQAAGSIYAVVRQPDGQFIAGGNFTELSGQAVHRLARFSAAGAVDAAYVAASRVLPAQVISLALQADGKVLAGTFAGLQRVLANGSPDTSYGTFGAGSLITALALQPDGRALVGGSFVGVTASGVRTGLARLTVDGTLDASFSRAMPSQDALLSTNALVVQPDGRILVSGFFSQDSPPYGAARLVRYEATGAVDTSFSPAYFTAADGTSYSTGGYALALQPDGKVLVGGNFDVVRGVARSKVARLTATGALDASFAPTANLDGVVAALALQPNGQLLLGGSFSLAGSSASTNLLRVLATGATDASFAATATPSGGVFALLAQPDGRLVLGGAFTSVGGRPAVGLARITTSSALATAASATTARTQVWPVPAHSVLHVTSSVGAPPRTLELLDALGRVVRSQPATTHFTDLPVEGLPVGSYLLRVIYSTGTEVRHVAVY